MTRIPLSGKNSHLSCLVDDRDVERVSRHRWYLNRKGYAQRNRKAGETGRESVLMHAYIIGTREGFVCDHINSNKLDNRRSNLRFVTNTENIRRRGRDKRSTTGYKGVYFCKSKELRPETVRYLVYIRVDKKLKTVGYFKSLYKAVVAYNEASRKYHGEFGYQNPLPPDDTALR